MPVHYSYCHEHSIETAKCQYQDNSPLYLTCIYNGVKCLILMGIKQKMCKNNSWENIMCKNNSCEGAPLSLYKLHNFLLAYMKLQLE